MTLPTVIIGGDVWPTSLGEASLAKRLDLDAEPDLFIWTLDAAVPAGPARPDYTLVPFEAPCLDAFRLGKANCVVTASNHITDFGPAGLTATLSALDARGFRHVGAGANQAEAARPVIVELPGVGKIALLAFAETIPRVFALAAGPDSAGANPLDPEACLRAVREAAQMVDTVWVSLHWGDEYIRFPDPEQRALAAQIVEAGASLVFASHTHVTLGYERQRKGTIFYGLGNFVFPPCHEQRGYTYYWNPISLRGAFAVGQFEAGAWNWELREIRLSADGLPWRAEHGDGVDYGASLPADAASYAAIYPDLRRRERRSYILQRTLRMSWRERWIRLRDLARRAR